MTVSRKLFSSDIRNQRTNVNAHLKPDLGAFSHHEMTLTLNIHTPFSIDFISCLHLVSGLRWLMIREESEVVDDKGRVRLEKFPKPVISEKTIILILIFK